MTHQQVLQAYEMAQRAHQEIKQNLLSIIRQHVTNGVNSDIDVHTEHCCIIHGCKYGNDSCPIETQVKIQSYVCEDCENSLL